MCRICFLALGLSFLISVLVSAPAHAQATRTWVSGVGDDVNPCSRTAPCKTFAGAISKTAAAGEIDCLDSAGFGGVTITKSITLNCRETIGSVLVAGTNGITISAASTDTVVLRNIELQGINVGLAGIVINSAAVVAIEDCVVTQFTQQGINDARTSGHTKLFIRNTVISHNTGFGMQLRATGPNAVSIENTSSINNNYGLVVGSNNNVVAKRSVFSGNVAAGVETDPGGNLAVDDSSISNNVTGTVANGNIRLSNTDINFNVTAFSGATTSYGNNRVYGNAALGGALVAAGGTSSALGQQ